MRDASNAEGIDVIGSIGVTIRNNYIHDIPTNGLYVKGGTKNAIVEKNVVWNTGYAGILLGSETDLESMRDGATHEAMHSIARNNVVVNAAMAGLGTVAGLNVSFFNNTVVGAARNAHAAFRAVPNQRAVPPDGVSVRNNVFTLDPASTRPMVFLERVAIETVSFDHNVWFDPRNDYQFGCQSCSVGGALTTTMWAPLHNWHPGTKVASVAEDPKLDPGALYRPLIGSPALDEGQTLAGGDPFAEVLDDYSGASRLSGPYDIGAHEGALTAATTLIAPTGLVASFASGRVNLTWYAPEGGAEDGFVVERSADGKTFAVIATTVPDADTFIDTTVSKGKTYTYRVAAIAVAATSAYSNTATVVVPRR